MKNRTLELLTLFISLEYPVTIVELEEKFQISTRTIRNELREINDFLSRWQLPEVKNYRKKGYQLHVSSTQKEKLSDYVKALKNEQYMERESRIFDLILSFSLGKEPIFLYQKEEEYFISKSTMDEDMRRVRAILADYGIHVASIPKQGILLQGSERSIRTMIYDIINRYVGILNVERLPHTSTNLVLLNRYIPIELLKKLDVLYETAVSVKEEEIYRNQLIMFAAVWLCRYLRKHDIAQLSHETKETSHNEIFFFVTKICESFQLDPPEIELSYIAFMLSTFNSREMNHSFEWAQAQLLALQLIQFVEHQTKIPFSKKEETLQEGLYKHITGLMNRVKGDIQIVNPLKQTIKQNYGTIYTAIEQFTPLIEKVTKKKLSEDEIAFLTIHFSTSVSAINQEIQYIFKAVVICNHGTATGNLLAESLKELFPIEIVVVLSSREVQWIKKLDVDLVFTTIPIPSIEKPVMELEPIIKEGNQKRIQEFLDNNKKCKRLTKRKNDSTCLFYSMIDLIKKSGGKIDRTIYQELETIFNQNQLVINKKEIQPMLEDALKNTDILLQQKVNNWEEAIQRVSEPLLMGGAIEKEYTQAMIESVHEFGPYIVIGKHIALAHARPEDGVNRLGISVATLQKPIVFGNEENDPVKIIFCLAAVDAYSHLNIMKSLVALINDEAKIEALSETNEITVFKDLLFN